MAFGEYDPPNFGDLVWNQYWKEFYVFLGTSVTGELTHWNLGKIDGSGYSNSQVEDEVVRHRTPFDSDRGDKVMMRFDLMCAIFGNPFGVSYQDAKNLYRKIAGDAVKNGEHLRAVYQRRPEYRPRRPQYRPTPY